MLFSAWANSLALFQALPLCFWIILNNSSFIICDNLLQKIWVTFNAFSKASTNVFSAVFCWTVECKKRKRYQFLWPTKAGLQSCFHFLQWKGRLLLREMNFCEWMKGYYLRGITRSGYHVKNYKTSLINFWTDLVTYNRLLYVRWMSKCHQLEHTIWTRILLAISTCKIYNDM